MLKACQEISFQIRKKGLSKLAPLVKAENGGEWWKFSEDFDKIHALLPVGALGILRQEGYLT